jgi:UDP-glucose 4-epimerase
MSKNVLVTGGVGFIGSHTVDRLVNEGYTVRILDNLSSGNLNNIEVHLRSGNVDFVKGDVRDVSIVKKSLKDIDVVIHFAAMISVPLSIQNPELTFDINLLGTLNMLRCSIEAKVKNFVFISSCSVCGNPEVLPVTEQTRTDPISPYAESKLLGERYCLGFSERQLLKTVVLRFFNVYGPRQTMNDYSGVITRFMDCCRQKRSLTIYGDGSQTRDFVNVKDVAAAVVASMNSNLSGEIFNVGSGQSTTINTLAKSIIELSNQDLEIHYEKARVGDIKDSYADISKVRNLLHYQPKVSLKDGLRELFAQKMDAS